LKYLYIFLILTVFTACSNENANSNKKTFKGDLTLTPAESALLCFDRMVELSKTEVDKNALKQKLMELDLYNKNNTLALFVETKKVPKAKEFILEHYDKLLLEENNVFVWKTEHKESLLFVKDEHKSIEIGSLVLSVSKNDSTTTIQFSPQSKRVLSGFAMKHINRPILLEINGEVITTVKSFGKLENGILQIETR
tara:strand:- start:2659 stop:3246 length:588 start_codon:yes stop_codon:yes gene_type:complete